jgi:hypothetical protein
MIGPRPKCMDCEHLNRLNAIGITCKAFPKGIPKNIIVPQIEHDRVLKGQVGDYVFKEMPEDKK